MMGRGGYLSTFLFLRVDQQDNKEPDYDRFTATACTTLLCSLHGVEVTTVEGLGATRTELHPIQAGLA